MRGCVGWMVVCMAVVAATGGVLPATAPSGAEIQSLIERLSSDQFKEREEARDKLVAAGEPAVEALNTLLKSTRDPEVHTSAESILASIAENRKSGPTLLTLHFKDASPKTVLDAIVKQSGADIRVWPDGSWPRQAVAGAAPSSISIDVENAPFWEVLREFCQKVNVAPRSMGMGEDLALMPSNGGDAMTGVSCPSGAFLVMAGGASAYQNVSYSKPEKFQSTVQINLMVYIEPRIHVAGYTGNPVIDQAMDDKGKSWRLPPAAGAAAAQPMQVMGQQFLARGMAVATMRRGEHVLDLRVPLQRPADCGRKLASLKGSLTVTVADVENVEFDNVMNVKNVSKTVGGREIVLKDITGENERLTAVLAIKGVTDARAAVMEMREEFMAGGGGGGIKLLDADGHGWYQIGPASPRANQNGEWEFHADFLRHGGAGGNQVGHPVKLVWKVPGTPREVKVPFEFKDLALPRDPGEAAP